MNDIKMYEPFKSEIELGFYLEKEDLIENRKLKKIYAFENKDKSVFLFKDEKCSIQIAAYPANHSSIPTKKYKKIMINCVKLKLIWI